MPAVQPRPSLVNFGPILPNHINIPLAILVASGLKNSYMNFHPAWLHLWAVGVQDPLKSMVTDPSLSLYCYLENQLHKKTRVNPPPPLLSPLFELYLGHLTSPTHNLFHRFIRKLEMETDEQLAMLCNSLGIGLFFMVSNG